MNVILDTRPDGNVSRTAFTPRVRLCTVVRRLSDGQTVESQQPAELWHFLAALGLQFTTDADLDKVEIVAGQSDEEFHAQEIARLPVEVRATAIVVNSQTLPPQRWRNAWRLSDKGVAVDLDEAKKLRSAELEREKTALLEVAAKEHMIATAKGDEAAATVARQKVQALSSLDKAALEASVAAVVDLDALDKHEPDAIKDAKPTKPVKDDNTTDKIEVRSQSN